MYELVIKGFKTKKQAEEFYYWYEGHAEQFISEWLENTKCGATTMNTNMNVKPKWDNNQFVFEIEVS